MNTIAEKRTSTYPQGNPYYRLHTKAYKTYSSLEEDSFWHIIDMINWKELSHGYCDYEKITRQLVYKYGYKTLSDLSEFVDSKIVALNVELEKYDVPDGDSVINTELPFESDDGTHDWLYHIVGLGRHVYEVVIKDIPLGSCIIPVESFHYLFGCDLENYNPDNISLN
ncbi:MAG: hypothetical protein ABSC53_15340 [Bacteroidota bacterium]